MPIAHGSKVTLLAVALSATLGSTNASAVHISPNGTGQVLIFPYYTVRNGFNTLINIANTQDNTKLLKVRFRESLNGREVMSFHVFLTPNDTWVGAIVPTARGARIVSNDNSCVTPSDLFTETRIIGPANDLPLNEFRNFGYTSADVDDPSLGSLDRTREGYVEIVEMGVIDPMLSAAAAQIINMARQGSSTFNCVALDDFDPGKGAPPPTFPNIGAALMAPPRGGLSGRASLINAATGANYSFNPTAMDAFSTQVVYSRAGSPTGASLADANPPSSMVVTPAGVVIAQWSNGRDAVSAALMRDSVANEFVMDEGTSSQTDWIVTMPTKFLHTDSRAAQSLTRVPFTSDSTTRPAVACEGYVAAVFNREAVSGGSTICGTPPPPPTNAYTFCLASTIAPLATSASIAAGINSASGLLGTALPSVTGGTCGRPGMGDGVTATSVAGAGTTPALRGSTQGPNGSIRLRFTSNTFPTLLRPPMTPASAVLVSPNGTLTTIPGLHYGLPVIGLMLHNYKNANVASRYGGVIEHSYSVRIE